MDSKIECSFCGKWAREVRAMVEGPNVRICAECVDLCWHMVRAGPDEPLSPPRKKKASGDGDPLHCSFCGKHQDDVAKLMAGIERFICDACIDKARAELEARGEIGRPATMTGHYCSFCGKHESEVTRMVAGPQSDDFSINICSECVALCQRVLSEPATDGREEKSIAGKETGAGAYPEIYCSFCGKRYSEVERVIAGPTVFICRDCVGICAELCAEPRRSGDGPVSGD